MEFGAIFPTTEIGTDPSTIRAYARTAEDAGYRYCHTYDHVLGADPDRPGWEGPYDYRDPFHEPLTLFAHLAGVTDAIRFVTGVLVLPQRGTALAAKQAAQVAVLSGGRLTLGVGVGWNGVEYAALGREFSTRGARIEEQIDLLDRLWTQDLVDFDGEFHRIPRAGIAPRPDEPIPVWIGGEADPVLRRAARLAEGWIVPGRYRKPGAPLSELEARIDRVRGLLADEGRDPDAFHLAGRLTLDSRDPDRWADRVAAWRDLGVDHLAVDTMRLDLEPPEHAETIRRFADAVV